MYPWINKIYHQVISFYKDQKADHSMIFHSQQYNGEDYLISSLVSWLLCNKKVNDWNCKICNSCKLIKENNHPDLYRVKSESKQKSLGIEDVRIIFEQLYNYAYHNEVKVVWIEHSELLTEQAVNGLLKILEEPPKKTYFILQYNKHSLHLSPAILSRCFYWKILLPSEEESIQWLKTRYSIKIESIIAALRLSNKAPILAYFLLTQKNWNQRSLFYSEIKKVFLHRKTLSLLHFLNTKDECSQVYFLISLITDAIKFFFKINNYCINIDQKDLIALIAKKCTIIELYDQLKQWLICYKRLYSIIGINKELILIYHLMKWEHIINKNYVRII